MENFPEWCALYRRYTAVQCIMYTGRGARHSKGYPPNDVPWLTKGYPPNDSALAVNVSLFSQHGKRQSAFMLCCARCTYVFAAHGVIMYTLLAGPGATSTIETHSSRAGFFRNSIGVKPLHNFPCCASVFQVCQLIVPDCSYDSMYASIQNLSKQMTPNTANSSRVVHGTTITIRRQLFMFLPGFTRAFTIILAETAEFTNQLVLNAILQLKGCLGRRGSGNCLKS